MKTPETITIGEFDPTGKTGIVIDRRVMNSFGADVRMLISCIKLSESESVSVAPETLSEELKGYAPATGLKFVKTGRLARRGNVEAIAGHFEDLDMTGAQMIVDACVDTGPDNALLKSSAVSLVRMRLLPLATLVVAYLSEASRLAGHGVDNIDQMKEAAEAIHIFGPKFVLVRSDRTIEDEWIDIFYDGSEHQFLFKKPPQAGNVRAGRDIFASIIVGNMIKGHGPLEAVKYAQQLESQPPGSKRQDMSA